MIVYRAKRRLRVVPAVFLVIALLLAVIPAASVAGQSSALDKVYAYLREIPGLKAQIPNLQVTLQTQASSPASWAAMGEVLLNKQLRNWFKPLVNSRTGWGQLPKAGTPVWATFVGLKEKPGLKGPSSIVVHQGFGDGSKIVTEGPEANPFEVDDTLDSFGIWYQQDAGFYPQAASSSVGPAGINWYDLQFKGAGGVDKKVMANVVPTAKAAGGGPPGGGNPPPGGGAPPGGGGNNPPGGDGVGAGNGAADGAGADADTDVGQPSAHLVVEERKPRKDPDTAKRAHIVWHNGAYRIWRDFAPAADLATCVRTTGTTAADGSILVEVTVQTIFPMDAAALGETIKLQVFDENGKLLGEVDTDWRSHTPTGPYQGGFVYQGVYELPAWASGAQSVRLSPSADFVNATIDPADLPADPAAAAAGIAAAHATNSVAVGGRDGINPCGTVVSDDLDMCSDEIVSALTNLTGDMGGAGVLATPYTGSHGSQECHVTRNDEFVGVLTSTGEPATKEKLEQVAKIPGCPQRKLTVEEREILMLTCEAVTLFLWLQQIPGSEAEIGVDDDDYIYVDSIFSAFGPPIPALPEPEPIPEEDTPLDLGESVPIAALVEQAGEAAQAAAWRWAVPPGENA